MILKSLTIYSDVTEKVIRNIEFNRKGITLIVDKSGTGESGSSIGKSTVVKILRICLGWQKMKDLYSDADLGTNEEIQMFLKTQKIRAKLIVEDLEKNDQTLDVALHSNGKKKINGIIYKTEDYIETLKNLFFPNSPQQVSHRELMSYFVKLDYNDEDVLKYISKKASKKNDFYRVIFDYLFAIESNSEKINEIEMEIQKIETDINYILRRNKVTTIEELVTMLSLQQENLNELKSNLNNFDNIPNYKNEKIEYLSLSEEISSLESQIDYEQLRIKNLEVKLSNICINSKIDIEELTDIYNETIELNIPNSFIKTLDEVQNFHVEMNKRRKQLVSDEIFKLNGIIEELIPQLEKKQSVFQTKFKGYKEYLYSEYETLLSERILSDEKFIKTQTDYETILELQKLLPQNDLEVYNENEEDNENKIKTFSSYLNEIAKPVLKESLSITLIKELGSFPLSVIAQDGAYGSSKKKAFLMAFHMAHFKYIKNYNLSLPIFGVYDKVETMTSHEFNRILEQSYNTNGQLIFPILSDRLIDRDIDDELIGLVLSSDDKLFGV